MQLPKEFSTQDSKTDLLECPYSGLKVPGHPAVVQTRGNFYTWLTHLYAVVNRFYWTD